MDWGGEPLSASSPRGPLIQLVPGLSQPATVYTPVPCEEGPEFEFVVEFEVGELNVI